MKHKSSSNIGHVQGDAVGDAYGGVALFQMSHIDCTQYILGYSEAWNTLNGWLGNR